MTQLRAPGRGRGDHRRNSAQGDDKGCAGQYHGMTAATGQQHGFPVTWGQGVPLDDGTRAESFEPCETARHAR